jgi:hypothetical protein
MLPGTSSRRINSKNKKLKNETDNDTALDELSLQYSLDKLNDARAYDFASDGSDGNHSSNDGCEIYPFASALEKNIDESEVDADVVITICIYQINTSCELPFIEFLMKKRFNKELNKQQFEFPSLNYVPSKRTVVDQAKQHINTFIDENEDVKYRGHLKKRNEYYLIFHKYFRKLKFPRKISMNDDALWWIVTSEILNFKKVMNIDVDKRATDFFLQNPAIMRLYDCNNRVVETPIICYYGDQYQKITYLAFFGLLKAPLKSSFGPFYVGTNFLSSMKYACYTHDDKPFELYDGTALTNGNYGKYVEGGVLRSVLFVGKMNVFLKSGTPDNSQISQEIAKKDEGIRKFLALRDSNGNWTDNYDTAYSGLHFASIDDNVKKGGQKNITVSTVEWFFKDYNHSSILSYHMIETKSIPEKYDVDYDGYCIK